MRKTFTILLLFIHLFNFVGYTLVFHYFMQRTESNLVQRIDNGNYDANSLMILKIPIRLPYNNDWKDFERVDGQIEINGVYYSYVERKISQDTVYLACLPNNDKAAINKARHEYAKGVNAIPDSKKGDAPAKKNILGSEYHDPCSIYQFAVYSSMADKKIPYLSVEYGSVYSSPPFSPPEKA